MHPENFQKSEKLSRLNGNLSEKLVFQFASEIHEGLSFLANALTEEKNGYQRLTEEERLSIRQILDHLTQLTRSMMDIGQIESDKISPEQISFSLRKSLSTILNHLHSEAERLHKNFRFLISTEVPDTLVGSPARFKQIFEDLLRGFLISASQPDISGNLEVKCKNDNHLVLEVLLKTAPDSILSGLQGSGSYFRDLQFLLAQKLLVLLGGALTHTHTDEGETFSFTFPIRFEAHPSHQEILNTYPLENLQVMILESDPYHLNRLKKIMESWGMGVHTAGNESDAEVFIKNTDLRLDFILIEKNLSPSSAFEWIAKWLRTNRFSETYSVLMTSQPERGDAKRCQEAGIQGYFSKPLYPTEIYDTFQYLLNHRFHPNHSLPLITRHFLNEEEAKLHILIFEKSKSPHSALQTLNTYGHTYVQATSSELLFSHLGKEEFDLILIRPEDVPTDEDEMMLEIRKYQRKAGKRIPILGIQSHPDKSKEPYRNSLTSLLDGFISFPLTNLSLLESIQH